MFALKKNTFVLTTLLVFFSGSATASPSEAISLYQNPFLVAERVETDKSASIQVPAKGGEFILDVHLNNDSYLPELVGTVTNNTDRDWVRITFSANFFDEDGNKLEGLHNILIGNIKQGETKNISYSDEVITISQADEIDKYEIKLADGTYDAKYGIRMTKPVNSENMKFEDTNIAINWTFEGNQLGFQLKNKTNSPIKINWSNVSYIDPTGTAENVIHEGVKYINRNESLPPTIVPPTAKVDDIVIPADNISYISGSRYTSSRWDIKLLFPEGESAWDYKGDSFSVFMPLEINGEVKNYTFTFKISDIQL